MKRKLILPILILFVLSLQACKDESIVAIHESVGKGLVEAHKTARRAHDAKLMTDGKYRQICASLRRASVLYSASCDALKYYVNKNDPNTILVVVPVENKNYMEIMTQIRIISADVVEWIGEKE